MSYVKCSYHTHTNTKNKKGQREETFEGGGYVYDVDGDDGFMDIHLPPNTSGCLIQYTQLSVYDAYLNKVV